MSVTSAANSQIPRSVLDGERLSRESAKALYLSEGVSREDISRAACELRNRGKGSTITYSPKVFLPLTNLCRDRCGYCTFRRDPGDEGAHWMEPDEVLSIVRRGEALGCKEALLSLGDRPEAAFPEARAWLRERGMERTLEYVARISESILRESSLLPHSNPGLMARSDLERLRESNASLGLMLESTAALSEQGGAHFDAVDKKPRLRLRTIEEAGALRIPFTTGILVGIGESAEDRIDALFAIRDLHDRYGHIQEVIVQNFVPKPEIPMRTWPAPPFEEFARVVAMARLILGPEMNIQAPPNLSPKHLGELLDCGINDWGGVSPLTLDHINPESRWPEVDMLSKVVSERGLTLRERLAVYPEFAMRSEFFSPKVWERIRRCTDEKGYPSVVGGKSGPTD